MGEDVFIVAIVFGSILSIVFLGIIGSIIKTWIKRGSDSGDLSKNKEFLAALRDFKEKTEDRLSNLEAIVADLDEADTGKLNHKEKEEHSRAVEIELNDEEETRESESSGNLRNMLNQ